MDRESFESLIKEKMDAGGIKPPKSVWTGIVSSLSDNTIINLQSSHEKFKWIAVASVFVAVFSFALNWDPQLRGDQINQSISFNALLPSTSEHFRFFDSENYPTEPREHTYLWSNILFLKDETKLESDQIETDQLLDDHFAIESHIYEIERLTPVVKQVAVDNHISPYYVRQARIINRKTKKSSSFWAGSRSWCR